MAEYGTYYRKMRDSEGAIVMQGPPGDRQPVIEEIAHLPTGGDWPKRYGERGLYLTRDAALGRTDQPTLVCPDCDASMTLFTEMVGHAREEHDATPYLRLDNGQVLFFEDDGASDEPTAYIDVARSLLDPPGYADLEAQFLENLTHLTNEELELLTREANVYRNGRNKASLIEVLTDVFRQQNGAAAAGSQGPESQQAAGE